MRLDHEEARSRLVVSDHAVLATRHTVRGVDVVPVVFAVDERDHVGIPVDRVKPKASQRLQRERNLREDPRAALLAERWDAQDWSRLWWVRAELRWVAEPAPELVEDLSARLAARYRQYRDEPFSSVLVLQVVGLTGWAAAAS